MSDTSNNITSFIVSFADDNRLFLGIKDVSNRNTLDDDLNTVYGWANGNNMKMNENDFHCVGLSRIHSYFTPEEIPIESKSALRDLAVLKTDFPAF